MGVPAADSIPGGGVSDRHLMELSVIRDVQWLDVFRGGVERVFRSVLCSSCGMDAA